ncbi:MAG: carbon monoxide dehydrogenase subunit G [Nitrososphaerota archaeon]
MRFEDRFHVNVDRERVWKFVTNPKDFAKLIPDIQKFEIVDERQFRATFKIGLGMIKGSINMTFKYEELNPPDSLRISGRGSGMQSTADLNITLNFIPADGGTDVAWAADLLVGGLVASVGSRLMESTTKTKVREIVEGIKRELEKKR